MPTELLFRDDAYATRCDATVVALEEAGGIVLDRTVFYPTGGGQPGDSGTLDTPAGPVSITAAVYAADKATVLHLPAPGGQRLAVGDRVVAHIHWEPRFARMRIHTALHLLTTVLPYPVTGGAIGDGEGRLDFDIPDAGLDRDAIGAELAARIARNAQVRERWITDDELLAQP
ncbi:MAG: alanyl-tRNA editing protein, partial [Alsobacter sp.]